MLEFMGRVGLKDYVYAPKDDPFHLARWQEPYPDASLAPISLLAPTQGLNITAVTYCDEIYFGITADPGLVPDPAAIAGAIPKTILELQQTMGADLAANEAA